MTPSVPSSTAKKHSPNPNSFKANSKVSLKTKLISQPERLLESIRSNMRGAIPQCRDSTLNPAQINFPGLR
ncbi:hypothetical protein GcM1_216022 [Golovinomyces cichoracearum]|uniref:Uncharacterized protein n=1 Tax=Golovinomyces cichoracearum TaxID=62708 RepID=A0A420ITD7_9PEZI|nr:hypothetical protein GcM1_216022 [Golovinomyces cichoracearum]